MTFVCQDALEGNTCHWLPCSSRLLIGSKEQAAHPSLSRLVHLMDQQRGTSFARQLAMPLCFSGSLHLMADRSQGVRLLSLKTGVQVWPRLPANPWALAAGGKGKSMLEQGLNASFRVLAFLPSGRGIVCAGAIKSGHGQVAELRVISFA